MRDDPKPMPTVEAIRAAATHLAANGALNDAKDLQGLPVEALARLFDVPPEVIRKVLTEAG